MKLFGVAGSTRRNALIGVASRSATIATTLASFPLLLHHLGPARFGIWATITSLQGLLSFADLGLGVAAANLVADSDARADRSAMRETIANTYLMLCGVAAGLAAITLAVGATFDLAGLVGGSGAAAERALTISVIGIALAIPLSVVTRVQTGLRRSGTAYVWIGIGALLGLAANAMSVALNGGVEAAVIGTVGGPVVALTANTILFFRNEPSLLPRPGDWSRPGLMILLPAGAAFFVQQTATAIGHQSDALIVAQVLGPSAATDYLLPAKLFYLGPVLLTFALLPLWPEIRQGVARGDLAYARRAIRKMTTVTAAAGAAAAVALLAFGGTVVSLWSSGAVELTQATSAAFATWMFVSCATIACGFALASVGSNRLIASMYLAMAVLNVPLSIVLTHSLGIAGVVVGTTVANALCIVLPSILLIPRTLNDRRVGDSATPGRNDQGRAPDADRALLVYSPPDGPGCPTYGRRGPFRTRGLAS